MPAGANAMKKIRVVAVVMTIAVVVILLQVVVIVRGI
jgi:hypothetical protein